MRIRIAKEGIGLLLGILVALVIAMSYANNLAYIFSFSLGGFSLVSLAVARASLRSLEIQRIEVEPGRVGETRQAFVWVRNASARDFCVAFADWETKNQLDPARELIGARETRALGATFQGGGRGKYELPRMVVATTFPAGVFRLSIPVEASEHYFVYPRGRGGLPLPTPVAGLEGEGESGIGRGDDFHGHRVHQVGEPERHVDWKVAARSGRKMVKEFRGGSELHFCFRREDASGLGFEAAIEQIAAWAEAAEAGGAAWGIEIGDVRLELGRGPAQLRRTLELLAVARDVKRADLKIVSSESASEVMAA